MVIPFRRFGRSQSSEQRIISRQSCHFLGHSFSYPISAQWIKLWAVVTFSARTRSISIDEEKKRFNIQPFCTEFPWRRYRIVLIWSWLGHGIFEQTPTMSNNFNKLTPVYSNDRDHLFHRRWWWPRSAIKESVWGQTWRRRTIYLSSSQREGNNVVVVVV